MAHPNDVIDAVVLLRTLWTLRRDAARTRKGSAARKRWEASKWESAERLMELLAKVCGIEEERA